MIGYTGTFVRQLSEAYEDEIFRQKYIKS